MTAVLSPTGDFMRDGLSPDDDLYNTDWRQKYLELSETLAETRADLEEFQQSSKELEEEMTLEIERTERAQQELKGKVARLDTERDEWKSKFMTLQTTHNTATTSLQKELDTLRQQLQNSKVQPRELEIGNDDLERNERAVVSSLKDVETKYSRVLEEKILLEQELLDKASLEEQMQRLKDELRDANEEISNLKRLLEQAQSTPAPSSSDSGDIPSFSSMSPRPSLDDNLLDTPPPNDLLLSDLAPEVPPKDSGSPFSSESNLSETIKPRRPGQSALLSRAGFPATPAPSAPQITSSPSSLPRPSNLGVSRIGTPKGLARSVARNAPTNLPTPTPAATKSRGVQMISALRSRVQTTQQRLIPGIPRLRLGSGAGRTAPILPAISTSTSGSSTEQTNSRAAAPRKSLESNSGDADRSSSPGWVLIQTQDDSPFPGKKPEDWRNSSPSPTKSSSATRVPSSFKPMASTRAGPSSGLPRRPPSRLSVGSEGSPRPSTPTFLPIPVQSSGSNPLASSMYNPRRSSLGTGTSTGKRSVSPLPGSTAASRAMAKSTRERPTSVPVPPRRTTAFAHSRIGNPPISRRSTGGDSDEALTQLTSLNKMRATKSSTGPKI